MKKKGRTAFPYALLRTEVVLFLVLLALAVAAIAHRHRIPLVIDNTFATPWGRRRRLSGSWSGPTARKQRPCSAPSARPRRSV